MTSHPPHDSWPSAQIFEKFIFTYLFSLRTLAGRPVKCFVNDPSKTFPVLVNCLKIATVCSFQGFNYRLKYNIIK